MGKIYIGIDASITSTAVCIEEDGIERFINYTTADNTTKWMSLVEPLVEFNRVRYEYPKDYSSSEIYKLNSYQITADLVSADISDGAIVGMEAYSQSSAAGHLIDLVTLGTFIRKGVVTKCNNFSLYAPMTMKKEACRIAYKNADKKGIWRNPDGVAGGSFKKHEMFRAMLDYSNGALSILLNPHRDVLLAMKNLPKPIDDIVDAFWAKEIAKEIAVNKGTDI